MFFLPLIFGLAVPHPLVKMTVSTPHHLLLGADAVGRESQLPIPFIRPYQVHVGYHFRVSRLPDLPSANRRAL